MTAERQGMTATWAALPLELAIGTIMFAHGLQKVGDVAGFAAQAVGGIPLSLAWLVVAAELGGGLLLLAGLLVRFAAFGHLCVMAVAVVGVHWGAGLTGRGGFEFPLALLAGSVALILMGPDALSIDRNIGLPLSRRDANTRRDVTNVSGLPVMVAGVMLIAAGVTLGLARHYLGLPEGVVPLTILLVFAALSVAAGIALVVGKPWAYIPAFIIARLYLVGGALLLFWVKFALRGVAALLASLVILIALHSARREDR